MGLTVTNMGGARVQAAIASAASATGVDFAYLVNQARVESGFNPDALARTSSATGLYQFIEQSWLGTVKAHGASHGLGWAANAISRGSDGRYRVADAQTRAAILDLRRNPDAASAMAAEFASDNRDHLEARLGHAVESVDLYLAHFLGAGGATKFLRGYEASPDQPAAALFPAAARANRGVFYARDGSARSLAEVRERFAAKFEGTNSAVTPGLIRSPAAFASARKEAGPRLGGRSEGVAASTPNPNVRLAYLMLASLGV